MDDILKNFYKDCKNKELHKIFERNSMYYCTHIGKYIGLFLGYSVEFTINGIEQIYNKILECKNEDIILVEHENDTNL